MSTIFDVASARSHFPALQQSQVFFDNAGGSQVLGEVIDSVVKYLSETNVQLGGSYRVAKQSEALYDQGMQAAAKYINAGPDEIVLGSSTTQLMRNLCSALKMRPGDEIILSKLDHEANLAPWVQLADWLDITIKWWSSQNKQNPRLDAEVLRGLLSEKTRLVACTHTSNVLGTIHDIKELARTVHTIPGAMICVDGVAYAPHRQLDVRDLEVDFYAFSWYKVYGPHISMLFGRREIHDQIRSLGHYFNPSDTLEQKLGLAGSNYELTQSIPKVLDYFGADPAKTWAGITSHEEKLQSIILDYLKSNEIITVHGEKSASSKLRVPVISFTVAGRSSKSVVDAIQDSSNFGFKCGHFYSVRLIDEVLGLTSDGVIRVSLVHYNTENEATEFVKVLDEVLSA
ncbi:hypothetical protein MMC06_004049 [Schaereria dolodes]|nr:hypothetical protein [Schaereria dolodes]